MCSVQRAVIGAATMGMSETVRGVKKLASGDAGGLLDVATLGMGSKMMPAAPGIPNMPALPADAMSTLLPGAPPPPAATASGQTASPFSLSMRPRRSQSLRTDKSKSSVGSSGLNIPT